MTDPILPSADAFVTAAIDQIVADQPALVRHFNNPDSRWRDLPAIWRAQLLLALSRLGDEVRGARFRFATGDALRALAASEANTTLPSAPQAAFAMVPMSRPASPAPAGIIRVTDKFKKDGNPSAQPLPIDSATYVPTAPVYLAAGQTSCTVHVVAEQPGVAGNVPQFSNYLSPFTITPAGTLFDSTLTTGIVTLFSREGVEAAGGTSGLTDPVLVAASLAYLQGQYGPTKGALIAGILRQQSVRHYAILPPNQFIPYTQAYIADESWASGADWRAAATQTFADLFLGFGCSVRFGAITNQQVSLAVTIELADSNDLNYTADIDTSVRGAAEAYFNDRPDWWRWRASALRSVLSRCDARIQQCQSVALTDTVTGLSIPDTVAGTLTSYQGTLTHLYLTDAQVATTYVPPS